MSADSVIRRGNDEFDQPLERRLTGICMSVSVFCDATSSLEIIMSYFHDHVEASQARFQ